MTRAKLFLSSGVLLLIGVSLSSCGAGDPLGTCRGQFTNDVKTISGLTDTVRSALQVDDGNAMRSALQQTEQPLSNIGAYIASCMQMMHGVNGMMSCHNEMSGDETAIQAMIKTMPDALQKNDPAQMKSALEQMQQLLPQMQHDMNSCLGINEHDVSQGSEKWNRNKKSGKKERS